MKDYGFGPFDPENNTGGFVGLNIAQVDTQYGSLAKSLNLMKMPNLASEGDLHPGDMVNLLLAFKDESSPHTVTLTAKGAYGGNTYDPFMYAVFEDILPPRPSFSVKPNEENPFLPEFEWSASDDDLWYGLLHIDTSNIDNQYHNCVAWIPLNEATNVDNLTGSAYVNNSISLWKRMYTHPRDTIGVANTGSSGVSISREGLAGYAGKFVLGDTDEIVFPDFSSFPKGEMTAIVHFTPDAITGSQYLMHKSIPTAAATATVTFTGVPTNDQTITIISAEGTTKVFIKKAAQDLTTDPAQFHGATAAAAATSLKACIEDYGGGHSGEINVADNESGVLTLTQDIHGTVGNTTITENLSNASKTNFTGGLSAIHSDFEMYINSTGNVVAKATPTGTTTQVTLVSSSIVQIQSPTCAIITLDRELKSGNFKLYINGKLEDQSGAIMVTETINNWKNQTNILDSSGDLYLGCSYTGAVVAGTAVKANYFGGLMEEIVIYDRCLYPVVPSVGNFILTKPIRETDNKSPRPMQARLFIKDYHNIRGTTSQEVSASAPVGWAKAGFRIGDT
jgi:hypothetical protein